MLKQFMNCCVLRPLDGEHLELIILFYFSEAKRCFDAPQGFKRLSA